MKKLFIAAMALATIVSCSKDEEPNLLESGSKSVTITIGNGVDGTRAAYTGGDTTPGEKNQTCCAEADDLKILFVNSSDVILKELDLTAQATADVNDHAGTVTDYIPGKSDAANTYVWHNVPWDVVKIAVVRYKAGDITIKEEETNLSALETLALNEEKNVDRELEDIVLYGTGDLKNSGKTHQVGSITYHVWETTVKVAPLLARVEVEYIQCMDLGDANDDGDNSTMGFDEIAVKSMVWTSTKDNTYATVMPSADATILGTLYGSYAGATPVTKPEGASNKLAPAKAWSWNVDPTNNFESMKVDMDVRAYDYAVTQTNQPLNIIGLSTTEGAKAGDVEFLAGNIYRFKIPFYEKDIKTTSDGLCVEVEVEIATWTVNTVYPVFGN